MNKIASFEVYFHQILDEHGELQQSLPANLNQTDTLESLYHMMVLLRAYDAKGIALQRTGKMGTYAPVQGQEAISCAIGHAMEADDVLVPYYRDYGAQLQRGVKMSHIYQYWGGDERGSYYDGHGKDFPISVPIASQCLHAAGVAFALKYRKKPHVAVTCIGEGGTSEGDFYEAINLAGSWSLPCVFVVNNNQWAISVPRDKQTHCQTIAQKAIAAGMEGIQVDGNDILACRDLIGEKIEKARRGEGPTLIEALTYRLCDHTTADDATRYQPKEEVSTAQQKEPLVRLRRFLENQHGWSEEKESALKAECKQKVEEAVDEYLNQSPPAIESMFDYHYDTLPASLEEQKAMVLEEANHG